MPWPTGDAVVQQMAAAHPAVLLAFSGGKDSIAAWLAMRGHFERIVPVYYYLVPDLGFVERGLRYYEEWFETPVVRVPHPSLHRMLSNFVFQPPERSRCEVLDAAGLPALDYDLLRKAVGEDKLGDGRAWIAVGTRACDSPARRMAFNKWGGAREKIRTFYPVWDWNKARVVETIRDSGVKLPPEYRVFGRSFDGVDFRFLHGIKRHWPDDYAKILEWFPLAELELKRHEFKLQREARRG
ncbi:Putative phosphoadenosine phosphosulfate reductase OS=Neisseria meningitidis serogroup A (strain WUE 2594) GN=NMAA_1611 PE=4 SV=1 [Gemmataceae bacterium]|nr:Putative phosphoadenosine phosphosulfate reductase OS=Neisseria meningitidis serogroup A (strain WUE 2594) GN=NMAA_1611 PE=4 SV=1 [Gemmataceae bacterium]VTT98922.1 Putative phosphoadenosine phosphosulfate reductase OS=Neisseria meningitidis serogroup A (strain WUE 2594) GN=NMAA_1611 PE=4 SV=1 [Gemmataceae bacterium]